MPNKKYVVTTKDAELTASIQRCYAQQFGRSFVNDVASGHLPMLTHPDAVVTVIRDLAAGQQTAWRPQ